jgi:hypothetical protein
MIIEYMMFFSQNLIKDPLHNIVVCGIPKNGITSIRSLLNSRCNVSNCGQCTTRCAEFKKNSVWNLQNQNLVVMFRDPFTRLMSAYHDKDKNPYISVEFPSHVITFRIIHTSELATNTEK